MLEERMVFVRTSLENRLPLSIEVRNVLKCNVETVDEDCEGEVVVLLLEEEE